MSNTVYSYSYLSVPRKPRQNRRRPVGLVVTALLLIGLGIIAYQRFAPTSVEKAVDRLQFDSSVTAGEKQTIVDTIKNQAKTYRGTMRAGVDTTLTPSQDKSTLTAYVPVTNFYASRQILTKPELKDVAVRVPSDTGAVVRKALATVLGLETGDMTDLTGSPEEIPAGEVAFIPADRLTPKMKLLGFEGAYYLDSFTSGAVFRQAVFSGSDAASLAGLTLNGLAGKDTTLKVNMTGVTALTRVMMTKLNTVKDPLYFSQQIGDFLSDADITHVSNEVSFQAGCQYHNSSFCSPPEFIETLKDSGVDLVELTGNHNNDRGNTYNTSSINQYHNLGMATFGGGLNREEAAKPYIANLKGNTITFIGYNKADGLTSGAIAAESTAGANYYTDEKAEADITAAKQNSQFVIVDIQYSECYAYPDGFVEYPVCDGPISGQQESFRKMIDFGADMVVGSSAHQPQTYELYKSKPIYYGLGNLYFDQTRWPGTERGIILTHYFVGGTLIQTKLSPTVYGTELQTRLMDNDTAVWLLDRLNAAR